MSHYNSQTVIVVVNVLYLDEEREIVLCFFVFYKINYEPIQIQYPVVDLRVRSHEAQSEL